MLRIHLVIILLIFSISPLHAEDIELGEFLSSQCYDCHAVTKGEAKKDTMEIRGMKNTVMLEKLDQFKHSNDDKSMMHISSGFLDEFELKSLAAYLESLAP